MTQQETWFNAVPYSHDWNAEDRTPIEGIYHGKVWIDANPERPFWVFLLRSERGFEKLQGRNQLTKAMELIPLGSRVRVTNLGLEPISGGMSERQFEVLIQISDKHVDEYEIHSLDGASELDNILANASIYQEIDESP